MIDSSAVWSRVSDRPYHIWQQQALLLYAMLTGTAGEKESAIEETLQFVDAGLALPKAHRDREFRTHLRLLRVTALTCRMM